MLQHSHLSMGPQVRINGTPLTVNGSLYHILSRITKPLVIFSLISRGLGQQPGNGRSLLDASSQADNKHGFGELSMQTWLIRFFTMKSVSLNAGDLYTCECVGRVYQPWHAEKVVGQSKASSLLDVQCVLRDAYTNEQ
jgi:hypothetical protein